MPRRILVAIAATLQLPRNEVDTLEELQEGFSRRVESNQQLGGALESCFLSMDVFNSYRGILIGWERRAHIKVTKLLHPSISYKAGNKQRGKSRAGSAKTAGVVIMPLRPKLP